MPQYSYLDTMDYYKRKRYLNQWAMLRRAYFDGTAYMQVGDNAQYALWRSLMQATDKADDLPILLDNIPRMMIENTVRDVLPAKTEILLPGIEDPKALFQQYICCGPAYARSLNGFRSWLKQVLIDVAQTGDGLLFMRLVRDEQSNAIVRLHFYPYEDWDVEQDVDADLPVFYRIEYKYKRAQRNEDAIEGVIYWHRFDIYKDHIIRYHDVEIPHWPDSGVPPPAEESTTMMCDGFMPPAMTPIFPQTPEDEAALNEELLFMQELGAWIAIPISWRAEGVSGPRGVGPLTVDKLAGVDDNNRLLTKSVNAAIDAGGPLLAAIDLSSPTDDDGSLKKSDVRSSGEMYEFGSTGDSQGKLMYPENQPQKLLHDEVRKSLRQAILGGSQSVALSSDELIRNGDVSGFAMGQITHYHEEIVMDLRDQLIDNAILPMLKTAIKMLALAGVSVKLEGEPEFKYPAAKLSADETLKMATTINILSLQGVPPTELVALMPFRPNDVQSVIDGMEDKIEQQAEMAQLAAAASMAKSPEDAGGVDKRARGSRDSSAK